MCGGEHLIAFISFYIYQTVCYTTKPQPLNHVTTDSFTPAFSCSDTNVESKPQKGLDWNGSLKVT